MTSPTSPSAAASRSTASAKSRRALHAYVSDDAHDRWHEFAAMNGVTVSGLLESMTPLLALDHDAIDMPTALTNAVNEARAIDARRRRRS